MPDLQALLQQYGVQDQSQDQEYLTQDQPQTQPQGIGLIEHGTEMKPMFDMASPEEKLQFISLLLS